MKPHQLIPKKQKKNERSSHDNAKKQKLDNKPESISENPIFDYSTNPPEAAGFSGTETLPQAPPLPSAATQATATSASISGNLTVDYSTNVFHQQQQQNVQHQLSI